MLIAFRNYNEFEFKKMFTKLLLAIVGRWDERRMPFVYT